jgi:hypothetical protein
MTSGQLSRLFVKPMGCVSSVVRNGAKGTNVPLRYLSMLFKRSWTYLRNFLMMTMLTKRRILTTYALLLNLIQQSLLQQCSEEERHCDFEGSLANRSY